MATRFRALAPLLLLTWGAASAFSSPSAQRQRSSPAIRAFPGGEGLSYGEESRKYRRTVYTHRDWVAHRSNDRIGANLKGIFLSGIVRQLQKEVGLVTSIAILVVLWNGVVAPSAAIGDWGLVLPPLSLPVQPFTLSSPALGLLLVFRTNASYGRWSEARTKWAMIVAQSLNLVRQAATFVDTTSPEGQRAIERLVRATWTFPRATMNRLSGTVDDGRFENEMREAFGDDPSSFLPFVLSDPNRPLAALMELSLVLDEIPIDEKRRVEIDKALVIMGDCLSACERIFTTPVPLVYTRHAARFLSLWMILVPLALYETFEGAPVGSSSDLSWLQIPGLELIPAVAIMAVFLFGIEELAVQLEEPFSILPMEKFCENIKEGTEAMRDRSIQYQTNRLKVPEE